MSNLIRQVKKRRNEMAKNNNQRYGQPVIKQIPVSQDELSPNVCEKCGHNLFEVTIKLSTLSGLNPRNPTRKDQLMQTPCYICRACGHEFGQPVVLADGKAQ